MDNPQKLALKASLKQFALDLIRQRIEVARQAAGEAQDAANQEEKSSAGDKYETGRAMGHLQREMYARQQAEYEREYAALQKIPTDVLCTTPVPGAYIQCPEIAKRTGGSSSEGQTLDVSGKGVNFEGYPFAGIFIAAGLGRRAVNGNPLLFLSPAAPLAKTLQNKRPGDTFTFNGQVLPIEDIF